MNRIDTIVIHCSDTEAGKDFRAKDIDAWHKQKGYSMIGYHYVIDIDGRIEAGRPFTMDGAHCKEKDEKGVSYNTHSIGICYIGGLKNGERTDTRTMAQKRAMHDLVFSLIDKYDIEKVIGHRDASPDKNKDGKITPDEWLKMCPCFDVKEEYPIAVCDGRIDNTNLLKSNQHDKE